MNRRNFLSKTSITGMGLGLLNPFMEYPFTLPEFDNEIKEYLRKIIYTKEEIDAWFAGEAFPFSKYHPELGWLLNNNVFSNGVDKSKAVYTYSGGDGERIMTNYSHKPCRINTYGNSFTHCDQVSDHETWQEVLAAHLQEPVRNFGIGGWSVYQAYLRMLKEEQRTPSDLIIFTIYDDDHLRNLDSWRNIRVRKHPQHIESTLPYIKVDLTRKTIIECENPCPTKESFYKLCDIEETYKLFKDDFVLHVVMSHERSKQINPDQHNKEIQKFTTTHGIETLIEKSETLSETVDKLHRESALFASTKIIDKVEKFASKNNKKVLYVLAYPTRYMIRHSEGSERWDLSFINYMNEKKLPYIDLFSAHMAEHSNSKLSLSEYLNIYFIGHYNPVGNFFFAWQIRNKIIEMLDPKPLPYL